MDFEALAEDFEKEETGMTVQESGSCLPAETLEVGDAIGGVKKKIVEKAVEKISDEEIIKKHSDNIAKISDRALEVEAEKQRLIVEAVNADNKVVEQEIKNRLIVLKSEAKRLKKSQKQLDKDQREEHKAKNKAALWSIYGAKLTRMKYDYVPCRAILYMLLFFDGVKSFFDGLGTVSTSIVKALKWAIIISAVIALVMFIPATREWFLSLLKFKQ